jgi:acyl-CoA synthetase (NDP forming)
MGVYTDIETEKLLAKYIPVAKHALTKKIEDGLKFSKKRGYPVVLKIISKQAIHKSDIGGVVFAYNEQEFISKYNKLLKIAKGKKLKLDGILIQEYVKGEYVIIGLKKDETFGHVIMVGIGGVLTELIKDISFRVCPISEKDASEMIDELKLKAMLFGFRGKKKVNIDLLKKVIVKVSKIPLKHKDIEEMDINPFVINEKNGVVVDARMRTGKA